MATFEFATAEGGGILSNGGILSISSSTVAGNTATGVLGANFPSGLIAGHGIGGGIALGGNGTATVTNTAFLGNRAQGAAGASGLIGGEARGGAIAVGRFNTGDDGASLTMSGCLLIGNVAQGGAGGSGADGGNASGGGIFVAVDASATLDQTVVSMTPTPGVCTPGSMMSPLRGSNSPVTFPMAERGDLVGDEEFEPPAARGLHPGLYDVAASRLDTIAEFPRRWDRRSENCFMGDEGFEPPTSCA